MLVYVGTYTGPKARGIYLFRLQADDRPASRNINLIPLGVAAETPNPSFFDIDVARRRLFAVNELQQVDGRPGGTVTAFSIDRNTGALAMINQQPSMGAGPCHIAADNQHRYVVVSNYGSGSVAVLPVRATRSRAWVRNVPVHADGSLGAASAVVQHTGSSINPERQKGPHAHCATFDRANRFVFVCDLGLDKILVYRFDAARGTLAAHTPAFAPLKPGAGPRHMAFRPDGRFAYAVNELNSTVTVFAYDASAGVLKEIQTVSTLPEHFDAPNFPAEIDLHPSGKWLYASNRGHNSVVLFAVDRGTGRLTWVEEQGTGGSRPRHFGIDSSGQYLAVGNQDSDTVLVCRVDAGNGRLRPSGVLAEVPAPACVKFLPPR